MSKKIPKDVLESHELNVYEFAVLWYEQNIKHNKKNDILIFLKDCKKRSMTDILNYIKKKDDISKTAIVRHIDYLVSIEAIKSQMQTTDVGRERAFTIAPKGISILLFGDVLKWSNSLQKQFQEKSSPN